MSEETEGDMAAAELEAEAERDNTPAPLPPCGPARDVVAEAREEIVAMGRELAEALYVEHPANARKREREVTIAGELADALITAARADERAQLAARATGQERELVGRLMAAGRDERLSTGALYLEAAGVITTLRAELTAARERGERMEVALAEMVSAMQRYESDAEGEQPLQHREMMARARRALAGRKGEG